MRYLEDLAVGEVITTPAAPLPEQETLAFAALYDPQPMHLDPAAAATGPLGGISASGWHTAAVVMRLIVQSDFLDGAPILGLGVDELRWPV
ncbi:MAG: MaoC/PaaZ C-terminal domain-containing protein, partial [Acidobacteriota bacterium]